MNEHHGGIEAAPAFLPAQSLSELAVAHPVASRVFHRHGLDFCCHGRRSLAEACVEKGLDAASVLRELAEATASSSAAERWDRRPLAELVDHILTAYHAVHRSEVRRLLAMARKVERVHRDKPSCPNGVADLLADMEETLGLHMLKEEEILFPMIRSGAGAMAGAPVRVMEREHVEHGRDLESLRRRTDDFTPPPEACETWRALYLGLEQLERDLLEHIHLENNVLFPRALLSEEV